MALTKSHISKTHLLAFLQDPASYPHDPAEVECVQTHASWVFMVDHYVYKVKKPVDFGFLDYSTLDKREHYCHREVELNRRLCSSIYLGVEAISLSKASGSLQFSDEGEVIEYAVKMKRLPEEHFLHKMVARDELRKEHINRIVDELVPFYSNRESTAEIRELGTVDHIRVNTDENFDQVEPFIGDMIERETFEAIQTYTNHFLEDHPALFRQRINNGHILDTHGDLHLEHINIQDNRVCIYDCIEFNKRFRYQDVANDVAFLAMDLDRAGEEELGRFFIDRFSEEMDDPGLLRMSDFYKCYRAMVRGKVECLKSGEEEVDDQERAEAREQARGYFHQALRYALLGSGPVALIFMGRIGTGKSTMASRLSRQFGLKHYASDVIRKELAGLPIDQMSPQEVRDELYSHKMSDKTYASLYDRASFHLQIGNSVILDATFSRRHKRDELIELMEKLEVPYYFVQARAPDEVIKERLKDREHGTNVISDARLENFDTLNSIFEPPEEISCEHHFSIPTDRPFGETTRQLYTELLDRHLDRV